MHLIVSRALINAIPAGMSQTSSPQPHKAIQQDSTQDDGWHVLEHLLQCRAPHLGGQTEDLQKQSCSLHIIQDEELHSFINRASLLEKNIQLTHQIVEPNLLHEQVINRVDELQRSCTPSWIQMLPFPSASEKMWMSSFAQT